MWLAGSEAGSGKEETAQGYQCGRLEMQVYTITIGPPPPSISCMACWLPGLPRSMAASRRSTPAATSPPPLPPPACSSRGSSTATPPRQCNMSDGRRARHSCVPASRAAGRPATASRIIRLPTCLAPPLPSASAFSTAAASLGQKARSRRGGGPCGNAAGPGPAAASCPDPRANAAAAAACWSRRPLDSEAVRGDW